VDIAASKYGYIWPFFQNRKPFKVLGQDSIIPQRVKYEKLAR
jgi:hypothetical protein